MKKIILFTLLCTVLSCRGQTESKELISSFEYLSEEVLKTKTEEDLCLLRNEVFARKGYVFKNEDLNTYFKTKTWYKPNNKLNPESLNFSEKEKNYINQIKYIEEDFFNKKEVSSSIMCIDHLAKTNSNIYPITENKLNSDKYYELLKPIDYNSDNRKKIAEIFYDEGLVCDITCNPIGIKYKLISYFKVGEQHMVRLATIKDNKIEYIKLYETIINVNGYSFNSGYYDIDFKLDVDSLEVYKIFKIWDKENSTEENRYPIKELRREVIKYKLTENGLTELE
ncbi:YARHG domain-containing protein [Cellulophaga baltica]|uniref:YARHG domain-containing protein n=1 Tax=Cellulophaga TaxID=104264 RepID=UPI001C0710A1|nr:MULTISPECIES: YARHG domain-containing protein [Cellulophaga]MBU2997493.1 YARHG domain-containing protein [Cellulophaga baltica]MDO6768889.1 YARHG domain-containing protein [Cellulophaga sp. 1_MG-2023]